jgi:hypothetical protein
MAAAVTITKQRDFGQGMFVFGTIVFSGNYPTGGEAMDLTTLGAKTTKQPDFVDISGKAGFVYSYDFANKKVMVFCNTAGGANGALGEHTAAAYAAGVSGDTVNFMAVMPKLV